MEVPTNVRHLVDQEFNVERNNIKTILQQEESSEEDLEDGSGKENLSHLVKRLEEFWKTIIRIKTSLKQSTFIKDLHYYPYNFTCFDCGGHIHIKIECLNTKKK